MASNVQATILIQRKTIVLIVTVKRKDHKVTVVTDLAKVTDLIKRIKNGQKVTAATVAMEKDLEGGRKVTAATVATGHARAKTRRIRKIAKIATKVQVENHVVRQPQASAE